MTSTLPKDFVIPLELTERSDPFRIHACILILADENTRAAALERLESRERAALEAEISYLTHVAKVYGFDLQLFALALKEIALEKASGRTPPRTVH